MRFRPSKASVPTLAAFVGLILVLGVLALEFLSRIDTGAARPGLDSAESRQLEADVLRHPLLRESSAVEIANRPLSIRVIDGATGAPVPHAAVLVSTPTSTEAALEAIAADAPGEWLVHWDRNAIDGRLLVAASAQGFEPVESSVEPWQAELTIQLTSFAGLEGLVVLGGSRLPGVGMVVLAKQSDQPRPSAAQVLQAVRGELVPHLYRAVTNETGRFRLPPMEAGSRWVIRAGGQGYASKAWNRIDLNGDPVIELEVDPVFGTLLRVTGLEERPLSLSPALQNVSGSSLPMSFWSDDSSLTPIAGDQVGFVLATGRGWPSIDHPREQLLLLVGPNAADEVGPNWVELRVPGYATQLEQFYCPRLSTQQELLQIELDPTCESWGAIALSCRGMPEGLAERERPFEIEGYLVLKSQGREDWFPTSLPLRGEQLLEGIPSGEYHTHFRNLQGERQHSVGGSEVTLAVGAGTSSLVLDLGRMGAIEFLPTNAEGIRYDDWFIANIAREAPQFVAGRMKLPKAQRYTFSSPPYVVPLLPEGTYYLSVTRPRLGLESQWGVLPFEIARGVSQELILPWDDR